MQGPEWRYFTKGAVRKAPCASCGIVSPWYPGEAGWIFRYCGVRGGPKKGSAKVRTERLCPACAKKVGAFVEER